MKKFLKKYGFYMVVAVCVMAVAAASYLAVDSIASQLGTPDADDPNQPVIENNDPPLPVNPPDEPTVTPDKPTSQTDEPEQPTPPEEKPDVADVSSIIEPEEPQYTVPVTGTIAAAFSGDQLVKNQTLGEWRTHNGIDYTVQSGASAVAVYGGKVVRSEMDDLWGYTVELLLDTGYTAVYCGLEPEGAIAAGMRVEQGDVLGTVGDTAIIEAALGNHLHFEMKLGDQYADPKDFIPGA